MIFFPKEVQTWICCTVVLCWQATVVEGVSRRELNPFTVLLKPMEAALSVAQSNTVRDKLEVLLADYFQGQHQWPEGTSVTHVGLSRILENQLVDESTVQFTMDGLVYFSDESIDLPTSDELDVIMAQAALTEDSVLTALRDTFPELTTASVSTWVESPAPTSSPTSTPTSFPSSSLPLSLPADSPTSAPAALPTSAPLAIPTSAPQEAVVGAVVQESPRESESSSGKGKSGVIAGAAGAGALLVVLGLALFVKRRNRVTSTVDEDAWKAVNVPRKDMNDGSPSKTFRTDSDIESHRKQRMAENYPTQETRRLEERRVSPMEQQQMVDDDDLSGLSTLDFNVDDLDSDFESMVEVQPNLIPVDPIDSFQQHRQHPMLKKDMLQSNMDGITRVSRSALYGTPEGEYNCALEPTDISAATLALADRTEAPVSGRRSGSLVPKVSWWGNSNSSNNRSSPGRSRPAAARNDSDTSFQACGWDPDDISTGDAKSVGELFDARVKNRDKQSLLQHAVNAEGYKMQRLRTPDKVIQPTNLLVRPGHSDTSSEEALVL